MPRLRKPGIHTTDPKETDPKEKKKKKARIGSKAIIKRNKKGELQSIHPENFAGVTQETMNEDRMAAAGTGDGTYGGGPAPRVGGRVAVKQDGPVSGGTKSMLRKAKRRVRSNSASKAAKRSAIRLY